MDVVVGFDNTAGEAFNITGIAGSFNSPSAFQYYVQNFTYQVALPADEHLTYLAWL